MKQGKLVLRENGPHGSTGVTTLIISPQMQTRESEVSGLKGVKREMKMHMRILTTKSRVSNPLHM